MCYVDDTLVAYSGERPLRRSTRSVWYYIHGRIGFKSIRLCLAAWKREAIHYPSPVLFPDLHSERCGDQILYNPTIFRVRALKYKTQYLEE